MNLKKISCVGLVFLGATVSVHADLIGHWRFDEGDGAVAADSSAVGNDGAINGAVWASDEVFPSHLVFDGRNDNVDPSVLLPMMSLTNDFTWAVWVNSALDPTDPEQADTVIIGNRVASTGDDSMPRQFIKLTPTNFEWHQNDNGNDNVDVEDIVMGEWHHVAVVKTGDQLEHFFDGVSMGTQTLTETPGGEENPFVIGGHARPNNSMREFFNGAIAEVRIYDEAISAEAVKAIYDENAPVAAGSAEFRITQITRAANNDVTLTWGSREGVSYSVDFSTGLTPEGEVGGWEEGVPKIETGGSSTTFLLSANLLAELNTEEKLFFRIREVELVLPDE